MNRLKFLREEKDLKQSDVAKFLNISYVAYSYYENEKRDIPTTTLKLLADYFNVSIDYILGKSDLRNQKNNIDKNIAPANLNRNVATVFVYGTIPAGTPIECIEDIIDTEEIDADMLKGGKQFFGLKIKGDSMFPEYLENDILILEKVEDCESGDDCVVMINGNDGTFKRVFKNENGVILQPLNNSYQPMIYTNEQIEKLPVRIIGKVVELRRKK